MDFVSSTGEADDETMFFVFGGAPQNPAWSGVEGALPNWT